MTTGTGLMTSNWVFHLGFSIPTIPTGWGDPPTPATPQEIIYAACYERFIQRVHSIQKVEAAGLIDRLQSYDAILFCWKQLQRAERDLALEDYSPISPDNSQTQSHS